MNWRTDIGLEIHVQLNTASKLFSSASTKFGAPPNTNTSYIDAGFPGTLPVLNREAIKKALVFAIATSANINNHSYFERKNYFYPDLPKGYQITQNSLPIISHGYIDINLENNTKKTIHIHHAHLEEDAGKLIHDPKTAKTYIDLNRAGNPLLEIVTTPCLNSAAEAVIFIKEIHNLVKFLNICDGNMQEGSFRCDVNVSIRPSTQQQLGTKTEIKNLNSFKFIEKAINFEITRQQNLIENQQEVKQETRLFCPDTNRTLPMRSKETAADYRYFKDPDLTPIIIDEELILEIQKNLPKLPDTIKQELQNIQINEDNINFILSSADIYNFYENTLNLTTAAGPNQLINWLKGPYSALLNMQKLTFSTPPIAANQLAKLLDKISQGEISNQTAKSIFPKLIDNKNSIDDLLKEFNSTSNNQTYDLSTIIQDMLNRHPKEVLEYKSGKEKILAYFVGQVMKITNGKADAQQIKLNINKLLNM